MRDLRKVREQSELRLTYSQFFALLGLMAVSLLLSGLLGYYFGRGATAAEQATVASIEAPLIPEEVETESVATLLALARERRQGSDERLHFDYDELLPQSDKGVPQALRKTPPKAAPPPEVEPPPSREVEPAALVSADDGGEPLPNPAPTPPEAQPVQEPESQGGYTIQVSSFQTQAQADTLVTELAAKGFEAFVVVAQVNGRDWYRVRVGRFPSKDDANAEVNRLSLIRTDLRPMVTIQ